MSILPFPDPARPRIEAERPTGLATIRALITCQVCDERLTAGAVCDRCIDLPVPTPEEMTMQDKAEVVAAARSARTVWRLSAADVDEIAGRVVSDAELDAVAKAMDSRHRVGVRPRPYQGDTE